VTPRATQRLQFHKDFTFADAEALVPYFAELGVSHLYASPVTTARKGSMHGYDVVDPTRINPETGGEDGLKRLAGTLKRHGMGLIIDIVPNHMAASLENGWWAASTSTGRPTTRSSCPG
jgi:(1->4)-alpha-D-glucan 1-alpha-D-glucosylmutase